MNLFQAISTAHKMKNKPLKIEKHGFLKTFDARQDENFQAYKKARWIIDSHPMISAFLQKFNWI